MSWTISIYEIGMLKMLCLVTPGHLVEKVADYIFTSILNGCSQGRT